MVFPTSLLAITCLINGVERFAGPLWAAKFVFRDSVPIFEFPTARNDAVWLVLF